VNGRDVRAKDVALLFADAATGAHSPALVSQGKIAQVIAARPTERRQMLEEAAGIAGLHARRKDAEGKLRATEVNLARLDELMAEMEVRAAALGRQAKAAERYRRLSDSIQVAEGRLIFARWRDAARAADQAKQEAQQASDGWNAPAPGSALPRRRRPMRPAGWPKRGTLPRLRGNRRLALSTGSSSTG
jgi:chromosome segregation protein